MALDDYVINGGILVRSSEECIQPHQVYPVHLRTDATISRVYLRIGVILSPHIDGDEEQVVVLIGIGPVFKSGSIGSSIGPVNSGGKAKRIYHVPAKGALHDLQLQGLFRTHRPVVIADLVITDGCDYRSDTVSVE